MLVKNITKWLNDCLYFEQDLKPYSQEENKIFQEGYDEGYRKGYEIASNNAINELKNKQYVDKIQ